MIAGLDETTVIALVAVMGGAGVLALLAAWILWRRERVGTAEEPAAVQVGTAAGPAGVETASEAGAIVARDAGAPLPAKVQLFAVAADVAPAVAAVPSEARMSRVQLFGLASSSAWVEAPVERDIRPSSKPARAPVESEIAVMEGLVPPVDIGEDAPALDAGEVAPVARRRPKPASELAEAGQTPDSLLARAHELLAAGANEAAAVQLRACARLASRLKVPAIEAVARLELGDLCQASGDMTTACEHWQIARSLYGELKKVSEKAVIIKRMEKAGCPTDWVLTKF